MKEKFLVSVIIPVFNAELYIEEAVESAINLPEVGEIILVEDNSPDKALLICQQLEKKHKKIKLYRHPGGINKGAGASRNLGIKKSKFEYISFLDADDVYLSSRFIIDKKIFQNKKNVDGIYNNAGKYGSNELYYNLNDIEKIKNYRSEDNLWNLHRGNIVLPVNSLTLKKSIIEKAGYFNEDLKLHEDTHLWFKIFHFGFILPGNLTEAVSLTREHKDRRIYNKNLESKIKFIETVLEDFKKYSSVDKRFMKATINRYVAAKTSNRIDAILFGAIYIIKNFKLIKYYY